MLLLTEAQCIGSQEQVQNQNAKSKQGILLRPSFSVVRSQPYSMFEIFWQPRAFRAEFIIEVSRPPNSAYPAVLEVLGSWTH